MWGNRSRKVTPADILGVTLMGVDVNADRVRAIGSRDGRWRTMLLDDPHEDLPWAVSMEKRTAEVGRAALMLSRRSPHLTCQTPLAMLGTTKEWRAGRHKLDPDQAVGLGLDRLRASLGSFDTLAIALPVYLSHAQVARFLMLLQTHKLSVRGTASLPLMLAAAHAHEFLSVRREPSPSRPTSMSPLSADAEEADEDFYIPPLHEREGVRSATLLIIDADDHTLSLSLVDIKPAQVQMVGSIPLPRLGVKVWKERLLDALSDRCIRLCRRDPRDSAAAEQALYDQLDDALERARHGQRVDLTVRSEHWFQNLVLQHDDFENFGSPLIRPTTDALRELLTSANLPEPPNAAWLTASAGRLPGLVSAIHRHLPERTIVKVLPVEAVAKSAARLAQRWRDGSLPRVFLDTTIPLPSMASAPESRSPASSSGFGPEW